MFDYLIKNGQLIDGTGSPARRADVGITDGKIAAIGDLSAAQAGTVIDAAGKTVTPGFIDIHRHADGAAFRPGFGEWELCQGLTTIVNGNCGLSITPCSGPYRGEIEAYLTPVTGELPADADCSSMQAYLDAARKLSPKRARRRIVAYVESYDDIAFWRTLLSEFENEERYFQVMLPSATSLAKGKKMVLMNTLNTSELGRSLIACVDSDYDFLLQGATKVSHRINKSPYIFQTYGYAIENFHCFADSLHEVCVQATLNDRHILDFPAFLKRYSQIAYPLFLWNVWFYRQHDTHTFPMYDFNACVRLQEINLRHPYRSLDEMQKTVSAKLSELQARFPRYIDRVEQLGTELERLGLTPDNTYLYIQGHHIMDCVVLKILIPVCTVLRREREQEIKRLAEHNEQFRNELTGYENSQVNVSVMLKKNSGYKNLYLYQWLKEDIMEFLEREEQSRR